MTLTTILAMGYFLRVVWVLVIILLIIFIVQGIRKNRKK